MNVANPELSKELHALSGWDDEDGCLGETPIYDLGFLLRKLPPLQDPDFGDEQVYYPGIHMIGEVIHKTHAMAGYWDIEGELWGEWSEVADTPEDAVASLAIELFKSDVLKKED